MLMISLKINIISIMMVRIVYYVLLIVAFVNVSAFAKTSKSTGQIQTLKYDSYTTVEKLLNEFGKEHKNNKWKKFMNEKIIVWDKYYEKYKYKNIV